MTDTLLQDKWDMMIDKFVELRRVNPQQPISEIIQKINDDYNYSMDTKFAFHLCERILRYWMDMEEDYYIIAAAWVIGSYLFDIWVSYPYIFINAVKRSGKTRLLKLLAYLTNGVYTMSLKEAVLFRLPSIKKCGLFIDETESISSHEKSDLRELLNVAYKKGAKVFRMRKNPQTEKYIPEEFELFIPVALANIAGIDDVLADRCISIILERSINRNILQKMEMFDLDEKITLFKYLMYDNSLVSLVSLVHDDGRKVYISWCTQYDTSDTIYTNDTTDTNVTKGEILDRGISGRDLELWLPLFITKSLFCEENKSIVDIAVKYVKERKDTDVMEDQDTSMLIFLSKFIMLRDEKEWINYSDLCKEYNDSEGMDAKSKYAMNSHILSRVLKRLKIIVDRRRLSTTRQVRLNISKIKFRIAKLGIEIDSSDVVDKEIAEGSKGLENYIEEEELGVDEK